MFVCGVVQVLNSVVCDVVQVFVYDTVSDVVQGLTYICVGCCPGIDKCLCVMLYMW